MFKLLPLFSVLIACCLSTGLFAQAPPNDNCADAIAIGAGEYMFSTINATTDGPSHPGDCPSGSTSTPDSTYNDIWYLFTPDFSGFAIFSLCSTADFDSKIFVYNPGAACPPTDDDVLSCNEDGPNCSNFTSQTIFAVTAGMSYLLRLGGYGAEPPGEEGMGTFRVEEYVFSGPPNAFCEQATPLDLGAQDSITVQFTTVDALSDGPQHSLQSCFDPGETQVHNNVWYTITPNFTGWMEWSNCGTANYDSRVAVYSSTACPPDPSTLVGCSDDGISSEGSNCGGFTSRAIFPVQSGVTYSISVGGWSSSDVGEGTFVLKRTEEPFFATNDNCATPDSAYIITPDQANGFDVIFPGNTLHATWDDTQIRPSCRSTGEHWDVWYSFNSGINGDLELRFNKVTAGSNFIIELYRACGQRDTSASAFCIRTDQITGSNFSRTMFGFTGNPTEYLLRVTTRVTSNKPGEFWFQIVGDPYNPPTSVAEALINRFSFAPNPAKDRATVRFDLKETATNANWSITNTLGQLIQEQPLGSLDQGPNELKIPLGKLRKGVYFFVLNTEKGQKTVRFVKE